MDRREDAAVIPADSVTTGIAAGVVVCQYSIPMFRYLTMYPFLIFEYLIH